MLPTLALIRTKLTAQISSDDLDCDIVTQIRQAILLYLDNHFGDGPMLELYKKTSFLDPRYKTKYSPGVAEAIKEEAKTLRKPVGK